MTPDMPMNKYANATSYKPDTTDFDAVFRYPRKNRRVSRVSSSDRGLGVADASSHGTVIKNVS